MATYLSDMGPDTWDAKMRAALLGDSAAYRDLLKGLRPWLYAYFTRRLRGADCEDLVQMTLLSLHEKRHTYDPNAPFMPWLAAVARHKLIDHVRKQGKRVYVEWDDEAATGEGLFGHDDTAAALARRDLAELLKYLSPQQARVIRLHKLSELSVQEVSDLTGHSVSNVKVMVQRGLKKLQALMGGGQ